MYTECLADEFINTASVWYSGERPIYAECAVPQTDCHPGLSLQAECLADELILTPNRYGNQAMGPMYAECAVPH
jgi:hypothetical protein